MAKLPEQVTDLISALRVLPGVGEKSASRYALSLLSRSSGERTQFASAIEALDQLKYCELCGFFANERICDSCEDSTRKQEGLCVVEGVRELIAIEESGVFRGHYHILGGVLNPLLQITPDKLRISQLQARLEGGDYQQVLLALNPSLEGDATCNYLMEIIPEGVSCRRLGHGVPVGGSLEHLDPLTIRLAIANSTQMQ